MSNLWVVNASPLITLAKVGRLKLVEQLAEAFVVPHAVVTEILAGPEDDPARIALTGGWGSRSAPSQIPDSLLEWGLGAGETSVLALALERSPATAVLDDASAPAAARAMDVPLMGTLGVVIRAKLRGIIPSASAIIADFRHAGLHLNEGIVHSAPEQIGEKPSRI